MQRNTIATGLSVVIAMGAVCGCETQRRFDSPSDAVMALTSAVENKDRSGLRTLFGSRGDELRSEDTEQDDMDFASFERAIRDGVELEQEGDDRVVVLVGEDRWPFSVPIVQERGKWRFDTDAGIEELENRRIGRNELRTIAACETLVDAQAVYRSLDRDGDGVLEYATRLMSEPGTRNGLYWPAPGGQDPSPIGPVMAMAASRADEHGERIPFHGYHYRLLIRQGGHAPGGEMDYMVGENLIHGWAVIAWPAEYDHTGIMTFLVSHSGIVYQADLGPDTEDAAAEITSFDPVAGLWTRAQP